MLTSAELVWLMAAVAKGDQAAFERLYAATRAKLYGVVLRILRRATSPTRSSRKTYLEDLADAGGFDPLLRNSNHLDGGDRAQPGARYRAQEERGLDRG